MESRTAEDRLTDQEQQQFTSTLSHLKEQGAALLVVGNVPGHSYTQACSYMLGDDSAARRRRLFVTTDTALPSVSDRLGVHHSQPSPETTKRVTWDTQSRSIASETESAGPQIPSVNVTENSLAQLGVAISEKVNEFEAVADGLAPAELRVCFDSLESLLNDYDHGSVFRFLHILIGRLRTVHAMGHFHLPVDFETEIVHLFAELFDATVELRIATNQVQHRWHLRDADITSEWLRL